MVSDDWCSSLPEASGRSLKLQHSCLEMHKTHAEPFGARAPWHTSASECNSGQIKYVKNISWNNKKSDPQSVGTDSKTWKQMIFTAFKPEIQSVHYLLIECITHLSI